MPLRIEITDNSTADDESHHIPLDTPENIEDLLTLVGAAVLLHPTWRSICIFQTEPEEQS